MFVSAVNEYIVDLYGLFLKVASAMTDTLRADINYLGLLFCTIIRYDSSDGRILFLSAANIRNVVYFCGKLNVLIAEYAKTNLQ